MKYIIYCRKSSEAEDRQVLSIESQENELLKLASKDGLEIIEIFKESKSAKDPGRPIFNEVLKFISAGKADGILCWKLDRLARNPIDGGSIQWLLQQGQIKNIKTFERDYFPSDNVLMMTFELGMANQYVRDLSVNVKRGNRAKLERGEWPNHAPFGYLNNKADKSIVIDNERALFVIKAYELYATGGYSLKNISDILYQNGLRTKTGKKVLISLIQRILTNPFYCGIMKRGGKYYEGKHKPLVSKEIFDQAQFVASGKTRPKTQKLFFSLRGFLKCGHCGCALTSSIKKGHSYYYCTNGKKICNEHKKYLREEKLHEMVVENFEKLKFDEEIIEIMYQAAKEKLKSNNNYLESALESLQKQLNLLSDKESRLLDSYASGLTRKELYEVKISELNNERVAIEKQIKELKTKNNNPFFTLEPTKKVFLDSNRAKKEYLEANGPKKKEILEKLLWNISIESQKVASIQFKMPYEILANAPQNSDLPTMLRG